MTTKAQADRSYAQAYDFLVRLVYEGQSWKGFTLPSLDPDLLEQLERVVHHLPVPEGAEATDKENP